MDFGLVLIIKKKTSYILLSESSEMISDRKPKDRCAPLHHSFHCDNIFP